MGVPARIRNGAGRSFGLVGQVVAILLLTLVIEFGVSTLLYERASRFQVRDDEAHRLAEHLVISRRLIAERPAVGRPSMAAELTTERYALQWRDKLPAPPPLAPELDGMREQVLEWEPSLRGSDLRLKLESPGRSSAVAGGLRLHDGSWLHFRTLEPVADLNLALERVLLALVPAVALMVLGGALLRQTLSPLRQLALAADRVGRGEGLAGEIVPVDEDGPGEVRRVVAAFNSMQERIRVLIAGRTQALAAVGHDLRTPLARLHLRTEALPQDAVREAIVHDVAEMEAMIGSLLAFLGGEAPEQPVSVDLAVLCATVTDDAADRGGTVAYEGPEHLEWRVRRSGFKRALVNLVENGVHYGGTVTVTLRETAAGASVVVEDDGPGIPEAHLEAALEPFVRLDPARGRDTEGFGLGLSIVKQVVAAEGGTLRLENPAAGGLRARIDLPRKAAPETK